MVLKELTGLTLTDLFKEQKRMWNYWQNHDDAVVVKEFRKRHIERTLEVSLLICSEPYERTGKHKDYRAGYWNR